jgi:S-adenosylmethionine decarboxylase
VNAHGSEWVVEAFGCEPERLRDVAVLQALFASAVRDLALHPVAEGVWHRFPGPGGVTGLLALAESHLTVHTFPEHGSLCLNLFCCTPRARWNWETQLAEQLGATDVIVRVLDRVYAPTAAVGTSGFTVAADVHDAATS